MDEELNRAIDAALDDVRSVKPAPDFLPRLRAHVEQVPPPIRWWIPLTASLTTIAAGIIVAALLGGDGQRQKVEGKREKEKLELGSQSVVDAVVVSTPAPTRVRAKAPGRQRAATQRMVTSEPEVLVPASARAAIVRLVEALSAGDERARGAVLRLGLPAEIPPEMIIEPIRIDPVVVPPMKESS